MCHATRLSVVSYLDSTSNHNLKFLNYVIIIRCFISWFYIKPQLIRCLYITQRVVSYLDSTSNHNCCNLCFNGIRLFHILILHQTTTRWARSWCHHRCFISWFYIKPQPRNSSLPIWISCFISWFYIKPQRTEVSRKKNEVVSYLDSTSNHN